MEPTVHEIGERLRQEVASGVGYLPAGTDVLRAFTYPMDDVRVLIVGQDPYPTPGHPMGLSFSVAPGVKPPRSLENIFRELVSDLGVPRPTSGDLTPWCQQGRHAAQPGAHRSPGGAGLAQGLGLGEGDAAGDRGPGGARRPARGDPVGTAGAVP